MEGVEDRRKWWREQYRRRHDRETPEQRKARLERQREYDRQRRATRTAKQQHVMRACMHSQAHSSMLGAVSICLVLTTRFLLG